MKPANWDEAVAALEAYQERLEAAARAGPKAYAEAFERPPGGIGVHEIDAEGRLVRVSPAELRLLGYSGAQMLGRPAWEFIVMQETAQRAIGQKISGAKELRPFLRTFRRADGSPLPLVLVDRHLKDRRGKVVGIRTAMTEAKGPWTAEGEGAKQGG